MARTGARPNLHPGRVYRTRDLKRWGRNTARTAGELVAKGELVKLAGGLYACPRQTKFGVVPPSDEELMRGFLNGAPFTFTGPPFWNTLRLGSTAMFASVLVYNTKRSGEFTLGDQRFVLRRVPFPRSPSPEWFVVDLLENHASAGVSTETLEAGLTAALREGRFGSEELVQMAKRYGALSTQALVRRAVDAAGR